MVEVDNKISAITLYLYNMMVNDGEKRNFKYIRYYLYFIKYIDNEIFEDNYIQTKSYLIWDRQEDLMLSLITKPIEIKKFNYNIYDKEKKLFHEIYELFKGYSSNVLRDISYKLIDCNRISDNPLLFKIILERLNIIKKLYNEDYQIKSNEKLWLLS